jgi:cytochrome c peroxidase
MAALVILFLLSPSFAAPPVPTSAAGDDEPIAPIQAPVVAEPLKAALGERLFRDPRLSRDNSRSCNTCHDLDTNGATSNVREPALGGGTLTLNTPTVFNAAANFRLNWAGGFRSLEAQAAASIESPRTMGARLPEIVAKLAADPAFAHDFEEAYGHEPDATSLIDALASFERTLITPGSRFDRWLGGDATALSPEELKGYRLFKSLGCVSCHQGVNIGGNLFQRHGIFHPLASPEPEILRVPSLRNVATTAPYFHDGSAADLGEAVERMAYAQLNASLEREQVEDIAAFLRTLTGTFRGRPVRPAP